MVMCSSRRASVAVLDMSGMTASPHRKKSTLSAGHASKNPMSGTHHAASAASSSASGTEANNQRARRGSCGADGAFMSARSLSLS